MTVVNIDGQQRDRRRVRAWAVLRRLVEASRTDVVRLLWPDGDAEAPARVTQLVEMLREGDPSLPAGLQGLTVERTSQVTQQATADLQWARANRWRLITPDDAEWPTRRLEESFGVTGDLTGPADPGGAAGRGTGGDPGVRGRAARPFALWACGPAELAPTVERSVALVGTRSSTTYGNRTTHRFAGELAGAGYTVVSGGAVGIDTAAHRGTLEASGTTVAVAAGGPGEIYPRVNEDLFRRIAHHGLVVTEYPPMTRPARHRFLTRNRLVAALTRGTVLLAAGHRSGAVNTANWADAMLRPVMVLPGPVDCAQYVGCHRRIRDGAGTLVTTTTEVREILEPIGSVDPDLQLDLEFTASPVQQLSRDQLAVFDACGIGSDDTGRLEQIAAETGLPVNAVVRTVGELEGTGLVVRRGDRWVKNDR
ncbi:DNA-processing protein DprA [uncultured Corynebacterium sp.]|uniref:DNA-processing protein DprA n=1 Tax=uncultured Corynebacterium sp. TaxID=159447 RepID=UPI00260147B7|nr:DNA-processing protein DprA [uncultured Corynebacterium sp.]